MSQAQMIARAWLDEGYRAQLVSQGVEVPDRPDDLMDEELDALASDSAPVYVAMACIC